MSPLRNLRLSSAPKLAVTIVALLLTVTNTWAGKIFNGVSLEDYE